MNRRSFFFRSAEIAAAAPVVANVVAEKKPDIPTTTKTAVASGDRKIRKGSLTTFFGKPGCGRSSVLFSAAAAYLDQGVSVKFISCEMIPEAVAARIYFYLGNEDAFGSLQVANCLTGCDDINRKLNDIAFSSSPPGVVIIDAATYWGVGTFGVIQKISKMSRELGIQFVVSVPVKREISDREMSDLSINRISTSLAYMSDLIFRVDSFMDNAIYVVKDRYSSCGKFLSVKGVCERLLDK